jgi:hypothetical protein
MNEHETKFIASFILKEKRNRWRTQLDNPQKRAMHLDRLNHLHDLDERYVAWQHRSVNIERLLRDSRSPDFVYVISPVRKDDKNHLPLDQAINKIIRSGWGAIISCIPERLAFYYDECGDRRAVLVRQI